MAQIPPFFVNRDVDILAEHIRQAAVIKVFHFTWKANDGGNRNNLQNAALRCLGWQMAQSRESETFVDFREKISFFIGPHK